jgi:aminobenzoyl-glutamate utilization protein B
VKAEKLMILDFLESYQKRMAEIAKAIWEYAELGLEEIRSSAMLAKELEVHGFRVTRGVAQMPTAFEAAFGEGKPVIGIIAEYDALPGLSNHAIPYKSPITEGAPGHGCGHNLFGTASSAAAIALKRVMEKYQLPGTIKLFGTPAEEVCIGKPYMAREGCFEGVDAFLDWHPDENTTAYYRTCNAYASVRFTFHGQSAHGNKPWLGRSALEAAELMGAAVNFLRGHMDPGKPPDGAATINYTYTNCGQYPNVIPDLAEAWYIYRIPARTDLEAIHERILKCAKGAAIATETEWEAKILTGTHELIPNERMAELLFENLQQIGPPQFNQEEERFAKELHRTYQTPFQGLSSKILPPSGGWKGVTDSSEPSWFAPYGVARVACRPPGIPAHSWGACASYGSTMGLKGMMTAAKALGLSAVDLLTTPGILEEAQKEFQEKLKGRTYSPLIPPDQQPPVP